MVKNIESTINFGIQIVTAVGMIVAAVWFAASVEKRVYVLEGDNKVMKQEIRDFMQSQDIRNSRQDTAMNRFADQINAKLDKMQDKKQCFYRS